MSISLAGRIVDNGLVFCTDTSSPRSYVGQPTTNYVTYPLANWNGSNFAFGAYNYANNGVSYTFDTSILTPRGDFTGVMRYYTGNTDYKYWSIQMTGLSSGTYAFSYYAKASVAGGINNSQLWRDSGTDRNVSGDWNPSYTTEWKRYVTVGPISVGSYLDYFPIHSGALTGGVYVYFWGFQLEKLSYATPLAIGTRSNTQGLLDLTSNSTIDLTNAVYDSSAQMTYNGSSAYATINSLSPFGLGNSPRSYFAWIKTSNTGNQCILSTGTAANSQAFNLVMYSYQKIGVMGYNNDFYPSSGANITDNKWHYVGATFNGVNSLKTYVDGILDNSGTLTYTTIGQNNYIGKSNHAGADNWFNGSIRGVHMYSRELTQSEILQNYNAGRTLI